MVAGGLAARAELGWRDRSGELHAVAFTPLVIDETVVAALPFDQTATAQALADAARATLVLSDSRMAWSGWSPLAQPVHVVVTPDRQGDWTWSGALDQEVRKYAPSRLMIDTAIQRREHWWYLPRWIVRLQPAGPVTGIARRGGPDDAVLFEEGPDALRATTVAVDDWLADEIHVTELDRRDRLGEGPVRALAFTHDFSVPDMERTSTFAAVGVRTGGRLVVGARHGTPTLEEPLGLVRRLARHWRRERACRSALASYDTDSVSAT